MTSAPLLPAPLPPKPPEGLPPESTRFWVNSAHPTPPRAAPRSETGLFGWLHANLFSSIWNSLLTLGAVALIGWVLVPLVRWIFTEAYWEPIWLNRKLFAVYTYPWELIWQPLLVLLMVCVLFGLSAGRWGGFMRAMAIGLAALLIGLGLLPLDPTVRTAMLGGAALIVGGYLLARFVPIPDRLLV
ncbi:MAG: hypothetical protein ACRC1H_12170, partial [Caldilineaceae bacterium]